MFQTAAYSGTKPEQYSLVNKQLEALLTGETNTIANLANASALLGQFLPRINWVGFYVLDETKNGLVLGPFQGLPACVRIPFGKGVCGTAAAEGKTLRIEDVHAFPGHIACDAASRSEIVVPLIKDGELLGVLDIDSPETNRFDQEDEEGLIQFAETLVRFL
ncbi:GAF domain-containing protein [Domibacillus sp. DTU_2020_1001157_1_SI_ALB_TIR_016]|uniref:GAF domain-containing protein n=1 Tax=Domibacillus sp. DTU_2020_1001157_1_SI_ALB_TIR_016 TaxID=3077789 RepID=UPI0028E6CDD8|nr:GAF domain-containing protein [Domibacillus sp. DTU_2020_1001157_1_SI_ALB_TIR_016]WNS81719.1 GAF domain-containing protein [Domibacillus sp. DTU_2020_1001157_1_SI_ALB_TIR_016]